MSIATIMPIKVSRAQLCKVENIRTISQVKVAGGYVRGRLRISTNLMFSLGCYLFRYA